MYRLHCPSAVGRPDLANKSSPGRRLRGLPDVAGIQPNLRHAVGARIEHGGRRLFSDDRRRALLTRGAPAHVDIALRAVGAGWP
jgi:hypothetical protein